MREYKKSSFERMIHVYRTLRENGYLETINQTTGLGIHNETMKRYIRHIKSITEIDSNRVVYRRNQNQYVLEHKEEHLYYIWLISILLYGSRSLCRDDIEQLIDFIQIPYSREFVAPLRQQLMPSYRHNYKPMTEKSIFKMLREIYKGIVNQAVLKIQYSNHQGVSKNHEIAPRSVSFDQGYYYLIANSVTKPEQGALNFRVDRIESIKVTKKRFPVNHNGADFFKPGEHVNMSYLMHSGDKQVQVKLKLESWLVQYMQDQFPYHDFAGKDGDKEIYTITVKDEDSILFWVLKQRNWVEILEPATLRHKIKETIQSMLQIYE